VVPKGIDEISAGREEVTNGNTYCHGKEYPEG
jgi:hypothetical protein